MVVLFVLFVLALVFLYRIIISILILSKKKVMIDEHYYILFMYISLVCLVVLLCKQTLVGYILLGLTPVVDILYYACVPTRVYWLCCGYDTNLATYGNALINYDEKYRSGPYFKQHINMRKVSGKIKITMNDIEYNDKKQILVIFKDLAKKNTKKFNFQEMIYLIINLAIFLLLAVFILLQ